MAAQRAALRRAPGQEQGPDPGGVRGRAVHALAAFLRCAAAAAGRRRPAVAGPRSPVRPSPVRAAAPHRVPKDVLQRMLPYWYDALVPDLAAGRTPLVVAHGNSLRALVKHLDGIGDAQIAE